jgi:hypothetical protein
MAAAADKLPRSVRVDRARGYTCSTVNITGEKKDLFDDPIMISFLDRQTDFSCPLFLRAFFVRLPNKTRACKCS